jgi:toxin ParE1/3/4
MSGSRHVRYLPAAEADILECMSWIGRGSERAALRFEEAVARTAEEAARFPESGHVLPFNRENVRGCRLWRVRGFENWLILYRETAEEIEVLRVFHGARDFDALD